MTPLNLGIIGYGGFGAFIHQAWAQLDAIHVLAVADANPARQPGGVTFYPSWQDLIADPQIDLVAVATPPSTHVEIACAAMQAGKHVLIEKPLATTREDAQRILSVRDATGRMATVDFMLRFNPIVEALHTWSRNGSFGQLRRVVVENYAQDETLPSEHWFWNPALSGGILVEHAVHFIDIVHACTAAPVQRVDGVCLQRNPQQTDRTMATVVYEDGLVATHYHAFMRPNIFEKTSMRFVFDLAQLDIEGWIPLSGQITALVHGENRPALTRLPDFRVVREESLGNGEAQLLQSGGETYQADHLMEGTFSIPMPKSDVYTVCLQGLMSDFVAAIHDPKHQMRVTLEDGMASLKTALRATEHAQQQG
ncbi:MAG TPA: Gfo/Idh/MocA family oxidoreductase [Rhodothermales bacterium]|nr:Gfo/Idh/MocA family oxidoreductase [Rhodothermales bacterium]